MAGCGTFFKINKMILFSPHFNTFRNMTACCGSDNTITLSNDGTLHSFGKNVLGQVGLGRRKRGFLHINNINITLPTPISNLPKISLISCGPRFTVCVDHEGFMWSFGFNNSGQLGTGNKKISRVPQKVEDIPPVHSVSCGYEHTLVITTDSNLWSCGNNEYGQLCLGNVGNKEDQTKPQKTSFSDITKISTGYHLSLFENNKGDIFACGNNEKGQCGLGHFDSPQFEPRLILNVPSNIVHFVCGFDQCLFLDSEGNVFSVGDNECGSLGLGHNTDQNVVKKIPNIPPIKIISCAGASCYLVDFDGNLWSFGFNMYGQLGHGDKTDINTPKIVNILKDIRQISYGNSASHFFAKNSQNQIFVTGNNFKGQLGTGDTQLVSIPKEINPQYSTIWRDEFQSRAKSARK